MRALRDGVDVVSGTPGRVLDLVKSGKLRLGEVQFFVLDEADRLLDTGNLETILALHGRLPKRGRTGGAGRDNNKRTTTDPNGKKICKFFQNNKCHAGDNCKFAHICDGRGCGGNHSYNDCPHNPQNKPSPSAYTRWTEAPGAKHS